MPTKKLSALAVATLPPGEWRDAALPGLILRVGARRRTWTFRARVGGADRRDILGHFPAMGLQQARKAGRDLLARLESGAPAPAPASHPRAGSALTLGALVDRYEKLRLREGHRTKTLTEAMRMLRVELKPWLGLPAAGVLESRSAGGSRRDRRARRAHAGEPPPRLSRPGAALGGARGPDPDQLRARTCARRRSASATECSRRAELAAIWHACDGQRRAGEPSLRPHGALPARDRAAA